jgi:ABC-type polysaccharide/polyol phosphate export permease
VVKRTILGDLREIAGELRSSGDLLHQLTLRDIKVRYKQAVFGFAWALLLPLAVIFAGLAIRYALAKSSGSGVGLSVASMAVKAVPWSFFVACVSTGTASLIGNMARVTKIYFPREVLPLSSVLAQSLDSGIGIILVSIALPFFGVTASWQLLWVPLLLILLWILTAACAVFLACANIFFRDVKYLVQVFLTFGIFVTPVILDAPSYGEKGARIMMFNPIAPILEGLRLAVVEHHNLLEPMTSTTVTGAPGFLFWQPWYLWYSASWAVAGLLVSVIVFHRSERRFAEMA